MRTSTFGKFKGLQAQLPSRAPPRPLQSRAQASHLLTKLRVAPCYSLLRLVAFGSPLLLSLHLIASQMRRPCVSVDNSVLSTIDLKIVCQFDFVIADMDMTHTVQISTRTVVCVYVYVYIIIYIAMYICIYI